MKTITKQLLSRLLCLLVFLAYGQASAQWTQQGTDIDGEEDFDQSGYSVSYSADGSKVAIGAPYNAGDGSYRGHVRVYAWDGSAWVQQGMDIDGEADFDLSGWSVSLSSDGSKVAIGARQNVGGGINRGHVRVYAWNGSAWVQQGTDIDGEANFDQSGYSVSLSSDGNKVAIGAYLNAGGGTSRGHVRVYAWNGSAWVQQGTDIDGEANNDRSGWSVSLSSDGSKVAIGAPYNAGGGASRGHVRVYAWDGSAWVQQGTDIDGEADDDQSGSSVSLSSDGSKVAIGAPYNAGVGTGVGIQRGHVRVYAWNGSAWVQQGTDIDGEADDDQSGSSVSLSSDGNKVAIGATRNAGGGTQRGHVRVYAWNGSAWIQQGTDIDGEEDIDRSGMSVSFSSDGSKVAVGAYFNAGGGTARGHVRVHNFALPILQYRTAGAVTFASPTNWESSPDGSVWNASSYIPDGMANTLAITIRNGHTATVTANITLDQLTVENGGILQVSTGVALTIADGTGTDLTIQNGGILEIQSTATLTGAGSFTLNAGGTFRTANVNGFNAIGVSGLETFSTGANYVFNGSALQTINNPTGISANNFTINNALGVRLSNAITVTGVLTTTLGDLDLNGFDVTLNGTLAENRASNHIVTDNTALSDNAQGGGIIFTGTVTNASGEIRGTGLTLTHTGASPANDYTITITRKHYKGAVASRGGHGIERIYQITGTPTVATTMRIDYAPDEIIGAGNASDFVLYRWQSATGWKKGGDAGAGFAHGTSNVALRFVTATGITAFSHWTIGSSVTPLPITLLGLKGYRVSGGQGNGFTEEVRLEWATASEINNKGFEVEMSEDGLAYEKIAFVDGAGQSNTRLNYQHSTFKAQDAYYRLKQVDFDGSFSYSPIVFVEGLVGEVSVYPNPSNGTFTVVCGTQTTADKLESARLLNAQGVEVWQGVETEVRTTGLPAGIYFLHTTVAGKAKITKIIIEK